MRFRVILCVVALTASSLTVGAGEKFTMKASPEISFAPAHLTVRTVVEPDADNRALEIIIDSADFYRSSLIQLEGDQAPRTSVIEFRSVPGGSYQISARLLGQGGESRAYVRRIVDVIANGGDR
jgi:hypothetical protein